jgi:hypothetical protein
MELYRSTPVEIGGAITINPFILYFYAKSMYILNPRLAAEIFDGEYIIANLDNGLYYNIQGIAVSLVNAMPYHDHTQVIKCLSDSFPEQADHIEQELHAILEELLKEEIVLKDDHTTPVASSDCTPPEEYKPSRFNRYADMQDLLLLDPIHDVDEEGWTVQKENN